MTAEGAGGPRPAVLDTVVFDLDGTLVDTLPDVTDALNEALRLENLPPMSREEVRPWLGRGGTALAEAASARRGSRPGPSIVGRIHARYVAAYLRAPVRSASCYPGSQPMLERLAALGVRRAVCTNKPSSLAAAVVAALDLARFLPLVVAGDALSLRKPDPRMLLHVVHALGSRPRRTVMIGDTELDVVMARQAGVWSAFVPFGYGRLSSVTADVVVADFDLLERRLAERGLVLAPPAATVSQVTARTSQTTA